MGLLLLFSVTDSLFINTVSCFRPILVSGILIAPLFWREHSMCVDYVFECVFFSVLVVGHRQLCVKSDDWVWIKLWVWFRTDEPSRDRNIGPGSSSKQFSMSSTMVECPRLKLKLGVRTEKTGHLEQFMWKQPYSGRLSIHAYCITRWFLNEYELNRIQNSSHKQLFFSLLI